MKTIKFIFISLILFFTITGQSALVARPEDGLAITHPRILTTLQQRLSGEGIGFGYYLDATGQTPPKITNDVLYNLPAFKPVIETLNKELELFKKNNNSKHNTVGTGVNFHSRLFDMRFLNDKRAGFFLIGVVNRMDKAYENPETCGETRLIFRLAYRVDVNNNPQKPVSSRLPMTLNLILNAKNPNSSLTCAEVAQRWRNLNVENLTISKAVDKIFAEDGPLSPELRDRSLLKSLEMNLQIARKAAAVRPDFGGHAVYLLKVFKWNPDQQVFAENTVHNQVDRNKFSAFYNWLFDSNHKERLNELDQGIIQIPETFLDTRAYSIAPGGLSRLENHPYQGLLDIVKTDAKLKSLGYVQFQNMKSIEGFKRRLTDISCTGCHQTRAIGGFHFMGQDPVRWVDSQNGFLPIYPGNAVVVPGSGHFFADLNRRQDIVEAFAENRVPDFSSSFSSHPQKPDPQKEGNGIYNGWGSHCNTGTDPSFKHFKCATGLTCLTLYNGTEVNPNMGVCVSKQGQELGDPTEVGNVKPTKANWFSDVYTRTQIRPIPTGSTYVNSPQSPLPGTQTGGFPGGSIRTSTCDTSVMRNHPEGKCGALPAAGNGFNNCIFDMSKSFQDCVKQFSTGVGLRGCSRNNPCRDDYICAESMVAGEVDSGVCVPPYFLFQFRVDGHPIKF